jgi:hypothetical protein
VLSVKAESAQKHGSLLVIQSKVRDCDYGECDAKYVEIGTGHVADYQEGEGGR